ncbi:beta-mannosidase precursor [Mollisia scopiformis]|uniref:Beta-mannosidase B n=1 Tax=Mollisia scopiformis TaxID=149040 RepID=A0A194XWN2_MOLSC|nr:beta-mannosidase precursor [Mollisia scopiformis]KUJ24643.1 beta-mannosidase precursor [Mollisia scopiformis]
MTFAVLAFLGFGASNTASISSKENRSPPFIACNGGAGRVAVRKAQYHWGWDWGPILMTAGPWRPVWLEMYHARVADLWAQLELDRNLQAATGTVHARVEGKVDFVTFALTLRGEVIWQNVVRVENDCASVETYLEKPQLWYPHGYGSQPLYELSAEISTDDITLDKVTKHIGLRRSELVQNNDCHGKSFYFRVNGVDVFCGGNCWIPADNFIPRITKDKYRKWLQMMVDGGQVMTRVWGGGVFEEEIFYDLCDELGILVWQDFMFACASYPVWPEFLDSVREEATQNLRRLRHHSSIVMFAGSNEDYQVRESFGLEYDFNDKDPSSWLKTNYPARYIFEYLLPLIMAQELPNVPYWPSSPYSEGKPTSDPLTGDIHQWNVFESLGGRFVGEFGMEEFPHIQTIRYFVESSSELHPQSHTFDFHNKADGHERRMATYLVENFKTTANLEAYIHLTQLIQSEALMYAYRRWRKEWGGNRKCGGALWQMNDVWLCTSWAIVDYFLRKKPAYYTISRCLAPIAIGIQRQHHEWSVSHARPANNLLFSVWIVSNKTKKFIADVKLRFISVDTGKEVRNTIIRKGVTTLENGTTEVLSGVIDTRSGEPLVLAARISIDGVCLSRDTDWPQPFKYLSSNDRGVIITTIGLVFEERDGVLLSDNALDIVPGDEQIVEAKGLQTASKSLSWLYLCQED